MAERGSIPRLCKEWGNRSVAWKAFPSDPIDYLNNTGLKYD